MNRANRFIACFIAAVMTISYVSNDWPIVFGADFKTVIDHSNADDAWENTQDENEYKPIPDQSEKSNIDQVSREHFRHGRKSDTMLVKFRASQNKTQATQILTDRVRRAGKHTIANRMSVEGIIDEFNIAVVSVGNVNDVDSVVDVIQEDNAVEFVQADYMISLFTYNDDASAQEQVLSEPDDEQSANNTEDEYEEPSQEPQPEPDDGSDQEPQPEPDDSSDQEPQQPEPDDGSDQEPQPEPDDGSDQEPQPEPDDGSDQEPQQPEPDDGSDQEPQPSEPDEEDDVVPDNGQPVPVPETPDESAEPVIPDAYDSNPQWAIHNYGQTINGSFGIAGFDINLLPVYSNKLYVFSETVIAVLDDGMDTEHEALIDKTVPGYDFVNMTDIPSYMGGAMHGTQVAGVIAGQSSTFQGVAENVRIMPLKFMQDGYGYTSDAIAAIQHAKEQGVRVINCSWGSDIFNPILRDVMRQNSDILFVCAAGNDASSRNIYPAAFDLPNVISVAAIDNKGQLSPTSSYGPTVDLAAPGVDIYTTIPNDDYSYTSGSSLAAAFVSGAAGLLLGADYDAQPSWIKDALTASATRNTALTGIVKAEGHLNIADALRYDGPVVPVPIEDVELIIPPEVLYIVESGVPYNLLSEEEKDLLEQYLFLRRDTMTACAEAGFSIKDSIWKARIMQYLNISLDGCLTMIQSHLSESNALREAEYFRDRQLEYEWLNRYFMKDLIALMVNGYSAEDVIFSYMASQAMAVSHNSIITGIPTPTGQEPSAAEGESGAAWDISVTYRLDYQAVLDYLASHALNPEELAEMIHQYQTENHLFTQHTSVVLSDSLSEIKGIQYSEIPFAFSSGVSEGLNFSTGALAYEDTIAFIPASRPDDFALDLLLTMRYSAAESSVQQIYGETTGSTNLNKTRIQTGESPMEYAGDGWRLNFTRVIIDDQTNKKYVQFADGSRYEYLKGGTPSNLKNYLLSDIKFEEDPYSMLPGSKYILTFKDGKKEYFDGKGRIIFLRGIDDSRFEFEYKVTGTYNGQIVIKDSTRRATPLATINYTTSSITIDLIDSSRVTYSLVKSGDNTKLTQKKDAIGRVTNYTYSMKNANFDFFSTTGYGSGKGTLSYHLLTNVAYPTGGNTAYEFGVADGNIDGAKGRMQYYRLTSRSDLMSGVAHNKELYTYSANNYTGYPSTNASDNLASGFEYSMTVSYTDGTKKEHYFDNKHLLKNIRLNYLTSRKMEENFTYDATKQLSSKTGITYGNGVNQSASEQFTYDQKGNLIEYWDKQAKGNRGNLEFKTSYTYDPTYNLLTSKTYKKDAGTTIKEEYILKSDKRAVDTVKRFENGVLVGMEKYVYGREGSINHWMDKYSYYGNGQYMLTSYYHANGSPYPTSEKIAGVTVSYEHDKMGNLLSFKDGKGEVTRYNYDAIGRNTKVTNPDGTVVTTVYNDSLRTVTITNEVGQVTRNTYDVFGNLTLVEDITYSVQPLRTYTYDEFMRVKTETDVPNAVVTTYTYDYLNRMVTKTVGNSLYREQYVYNDVVNAMQSSVAVTILGGEYAPSITTTTYTNLYGFVEQITRPAATSGTAATDRYEYDYIGNNTVKKTADGSVSRFTYDNGNRLIQTANPDGSVYRTAYDWLGRKTSATDAKGNIAKYHYNNLGYLIREELPFEGQYKTNKYYEYDNNGNLTKQQASNNIPGQANEHSQTEYTYGLRNRLQQVKLYNKGILENTAAYTYDAAGNTTSVSTGSTQYRYEYNKQSRLLSVTDPMGMKETYTYDANGNRLTKTDRNGNVTKTVYDILNRVTSVRVTKADGSAAAEYMSYTYLSTGAVRLKQNENLTVFYEYDSAGRLRRETERTTRESRIGGSLGTTAFFSPLTTDKSYRYDVMGNRNDMMIAVDDQTYNRSYKYDNMNRLQSVYTGGRTDVSYTYDANGNRASMTYANGNTTMYTYNDANLVKSVKNYKDNADTTLLSSYDYTYRLDGNQVSKKDHTGRQTAYAYDDLGRLVNETETHGGWKRSMAYTFDVYGNRRTMTVSEMGQNLYTTTYSYDQNNRLLREAKVTAAPSGEVKHYTDYTYDYNGNQRAKISYEDDPLYGGVPRLGIIDAAKQSTDHAYDNNGYQSARVIYEDDALYDGVPRLGIIGAVQGVSPTSRVSEFSNYDVFNRLIKTEGNAGTAVYNYKPDNMRLSKTVDNQTTTHVWDGDSIVMDLYAPTGTYTAAPVSGMVYSRGIGLISRTDVVFGQKHNLTPDYQYYLFDAHGDVVQLSSESGSVIKYYAYDAFGNEVNPDPDDTNPFRYCGEYFDSNSGTYYLRARYYNPATGRFLSEDPIRDGLNWYTYCGNNPIMYIDPSGQSFISAIITASVGAAKAAVAGSAKSVASSAKTTSTSSKSTSTSSVSTSASKSSPAPVSASASKSSSSPAASQTLNSTPISVAVAGSNIGYAVAVPPAVKTSSTGVSVSGPAISGNVSSEIYKGSYSVTAGYFEVNGRGQAEAKTSGNSALIGGFLKASGANAVAEIGVGNEDISMSLKGVADVLTATAQAGVQIKDGFGVGAKAKAKAAIATGRATLEFDIHGWEIEFGVTGDLGSIGAEASYKYAPTIGYEVQSNASFGIGGGFIFRIKP